MLHDPLRIALLISGGGTTMRAIIQACKEGVLKGKVKPALVVSSKPNAGGIQKAKDEGILKGNIRVLVRKDFSTPDDFGEAILKECRLHEVDFIGQYGWMVLTPENVIRAFPKMMTNQHPGPPPEFGGEGMFGLRVHAAVIWFAHNCGRPFYTEAVAQYVDPEYDMGTVVKSQEVEVLQSDDPISLQERVLPIEHKVQIEALLDFANGTVTEVAREEPLILPEERVLLGEARRVGITMFPKG